MRLTSKTSAQLSLLRPASRQVLPIFCVQSQNSQMGMKRMSSSCSSSGLCGKSDMVSMHDLLADRKEKIVIKPVTSDTVVKEKPVCMDGNEAAAHVAYAMSEVAFIFPITPASPMGELSDAWSVEKRKNIDGQCLDVVQMQSEGGASAALHGAVAGGAFTTTFTSSQGLLLMIPPMFRVVGELMPCVYHVAARAVTGQGFTIFADHGDVMACRQTGVAMLSSHSVQESMDLALVSHLATLKSKLPFIHFFDGFRTSHEISKITPISYQTIAKLAKDPSIVEAKRLHKQRALHPYHPHHRGNVQPPEVYMSALETANKYYDAAPSIVQSVMDDVARVTGRSYHLFDYVGHPCATRVVVIMGSGSQTVEEVVHQINASDETEKVGVVKVHLYRPWSIDHFLSSLPATVKKIAVLDRCKEGGATGEPLYLDVSGSLAEATVRGLFDKQQPVKVIGGRFGQASREFTPSMVSSVFDNLNAVKPTLHFTVGINDDVTHRSLPVTRPLYTVPKGTVECVFWGLGADGTVGANKEAIAMIGDHTSLYVQGYFAFDAHKSGGLTISHLRFGPKPITSQYLVEQASYVACHHHPYVTKFDVLKNITTNGVFVLNTPWSQSDLETQLPASVKRQLVEKKVRFYTVDARKIAESVGLGKRINMVMQVCFFALSQVMPLSEAIPLLKEAIKRSYGNKGDKVVNMNMAAVDKALAGLQEVRVPDSWANAKDDEEAARVQKEKMAKLPEFVSKVMIPYSRMEAADLPVSAFPEGGIQPVETTRYQKRAIATTTPFWLAEKCTQCNNCAFVCPHAAIRPFLQSEQDENKAKEDKTLPSGGWVSKKLSLSGSGANDQVKDLNLRFSIQVAPYDCTGCGLCAAYCPDKALEMRPVLSQGAMQHEAFEYAQLPSHRDYSGMFDKFTLRGSQFQQPLLEFHGACEGCGETPYVKLITQLFGPRMVIANATGCSCVWGGTFGYAPYSRTRQGKGPAYGTCLFENNAEYGLGQYRAYTSMRGRLDMLVKELLADSTSTGAASMSEELRTAMRQWTEQWPNARGKEADKVCDLADNIWRLLSKHKKSGGSKWTTKLQEIDDIKDGFPALSHWMIGGDGWAYDIGYAGVDHILASGEKVNIIVLDNELYSNTGGQKSKATPMGAVVKFAAGGNQRQKKDLAMLAMQYGDVYVASVALGANMKQLLQALVEAEAYPGTSLIVAYVPCHMHNSALYLTSERERLAVNSGYWPLYRYNPLLTLEGKNPFQLDSKKIRADLQKFLSQDLRYNQLMRSSPATAKKLHGLLKMHTKERHSLLQARSEEEKPAAEKEDS